MYIEPNTTIRMLKNVPLDKKHTDTYWFTSVEEQAEAFKLYTKLPILNNQTYQRVNKGECIVKLKADDLYDCNYMMFQNTNYGTKWFYAFIDKVEYVSNVACKVFYTIDVLQTWLMEITFRECFVEREHSETDVIGENLVPEKLEMGEYISEDFIGTAKMGDYKIVVASTFDKDGDDVAGAMYSNIYSGITFNVFDTASEVNDFIRDNISKTDGIVSIFMYPNNFISTSGTSVKSYDLDIEKIDTTFKQFGDELSPQEYTPRNKKLLTYPYNFLYVSNLEGNSAVFPYEFFSTDTCNFLLVGDFSCNPTIILAPKNYKGVTMNYDEKLSVSGFPQCAYNTDTFKAWLAQNAVGVVGAVVGAGVLTALTGGTGLAVAGAMVSTGVSGVAQTLGQAFPHAIMPNQAHGNPGNSTQVAVGIKDYAFMHKHITIEYAKIIDNFFDMYGYATHRVKIPNLFDSNKTARKYWNYIKTRDCNIVGAMPSDDKQSICEIFNNGVRFWTWGSLLTTVGNPQIGDYSKLHNEV